MSWAQCLDHIGRADGVVPLSIVAAVLIIAIVVITSTVTIWLTGRSEQQRSPSPRGDAGSLDQPESHPGPSPSQVGACTGLDIWKLHPKSWKHNQSLIFAVGLWADARLHREPGAELRAMQAFNDFSRWCEGQGMEPCAVAAFGRAFTMVVENWGSRKVKRRQYAVYIGCRIADEPQCTTQT